MNSRHCPSCNFNKVIKNGKQNNVQRYLCESCHKTWSSKHGRLKRNKIAESIWLDYSKNHTVVRALASRCYKSPRTIRRLISQHADNSIIQSPGSLTLIMDVTYFIRSNGELIVIDPNYKDGENELIYHQHINHTEM